MNAYAMRWEKHKQQPSLADEQAAILFPGRWSPDDQNGSILFSPGECVRSIDRP